MAKKLKKSEPCWTLVASSRVNVVDAMIRGFNPLFRIVNDYIRFGQIANPAEREITIYPRRDN